MNNKEIAEIYNQTFGGLTLFYRDTNLSEDLISKYEIGQILLERGFTDMSFKGGGISTNCRYLIASAFGKDVSSIMPDTIEFGHTMLPSGAYFKVLDIYKVDGKSQIFLLNIPENVTEFFYKATSSVENDIVIKARESFDSKINSEPIAELEKDEWKNRIEFPIGMSEKGEFFNQNLTKNNSEIKTNSLKENKSWWKFW
ncbi:hypothetical protein [Psychroserpens algicola]|uniref:Uncharacterized protein n=1 Tax=Psychroserpens algicola TaxID=1719034 RepID=A0ABT0HE34_9FLAO|nr:hypothetical protein [Psychroserpens algicola]MCK8482319.1 hypothetical protein [Psychroserpens algicola]